MPNKTALIKESLLALGAASAASSVSASLIYVSNASFTLTDGATWYLDGSGASITGLNYVDSLSDIYLNGVQPGTDLEFVQDIAATNSGYSVRSMSPGASITPSSFSVTDNNTGMYQFRVLASSSFTQGDFVQFGNADNPGYAAFRFTLNGNTETGWVQLSINPDLTVDLIDWAYTTGQESISVGQTAIVPEPASTAGCLGLLALGAAGVARYRRKRKQEMGT